MPDAIMTPGPIPSDDVNRFLACFRNRSGNTASADGSAFPLLQELKAAPISTPFTGFNGYPHFFAVDIMASHFLGCSTLFGKRSQGTASALFPGA